MSELETAAAELVRQVEVFIEGVNKYMNDEDDDTVLSYGQEPLLPALERVRLCLADMRCPGSPCCRTNEECARTLAGTADMRAGNGE
jgi:hypothetical protein